jgi:uncharacterized protein (DUF58 family)
VKWSLSIPAPPLSPAKDFGDYAAFTGKISRWIWRVYTQRFTSAGRWFALASGAMLSYSGSSLNLQGYVPASYVGAIWLVASIALLIWRPRADVALRLGARVCAGERIPLDVDVTNLSRWRGGDLVVVPHRLPRQVDCEPEFGANLPDLGAGQTATAKLFLRCAQRGVFELRGVRVESGFPFGLLRARRVFHRKHRLIVYPRFTPLIRLALPTGRRYQPGGVALASELGESFEYLGNREFREGDNVRDIDWRATARLGGTGTPVVREWVEEYMLRVGVVLDTHVPADLSRRATAARRDALERAVSTAAAVSDHMARNDYLVDIFAAGPDLHHLTAGRSLAYLDQILEILACVGESPAEPFAVIGPGLAELLERLSTVILIVLDWNAPRQEFARWLAERGVAVKIIWVGDGDPPTAADVGDISAVTADDFALGVSEL